MKASLKVLKTTQTGNWDFFILLNIYVCMPQLSVQFVQVYMLQCSISTSSFCFHELLASACENLFYSD